MKLSRYLPLIGFAAAMAAQNPVPLVNNPLVPATVAPGGPDFILTVNGTGFMPDSVVRWNSGVLQTSYISNSQLKATVPASKTANRGTASVAVVNPPPGGGASNVVDLQVRRQFPAVSLGQSLPFALPNAEGDVVGDFNGDGKLDLAFALSSGQGGVPGPVALALGNGDGTFKGLVDYPFDLQFPSTPLALDLNHDGKMDLLLIGYGAGDSDVSVLLGNGDGTFQTPRDSFISNTASGTFAVAGDFNGDGRPDVAVGLYIFQGDAEVAVLLGNGDGSFQSPNFFTVGSQYTASMAAGDFNGDGKLDLAICVVPPDRSGHLVVVLGNGDGTFGTPTSYDLPLETYNLVAADFDSDGILDVALAPYGWDSVLFFHGNGDGTFAPFLTCPTAGFSTGQLFAADLDGDGKLDLVTAGYFYEPFSGGRVTYNQIIALMGRGDGSFRPEYFPADSLFYLATGDFNRDGKVDIAAVGEPNRFGPISLYILPQSDAVLSQSLVNFGAVEVGNSTSVPVTFTNLGGRSVDIKKINVVRDVGVFSQTNDCGTSLAVGAHCTLTLVFKPRSPGFYFDAKVRISDSAVPGLQEIEMKGRGGK